MSSEAATSSGPRIPKPQMRGLHMNYTKKTLIGAFVVTVTSGILAKRFIGDERKKSYAEFYQNYDAEKECERMARAGLLQSAQNH